MNVPVQASLDESAPSFHTLDHTPEDRKLQLRSGAMSVGVNALILFFGLWLNGIMPAPRRAAVYPTIEQLRRDATPLVAPLRELTQKEPNKGPVSKEFNAESIRPREAQESLPRPGAAALPRKQAQKFTPPAAQPRGAAPAPTLVETPAIEIGQVKPPQGMPPGLGANTLPPPPQIQAQEKPKLTFENPGSQTGVAGQTGRIPVPPKTSIEDAVRSVARGAGAGGMIVGDEDAGSLASPLARSSPAPGKLGSSLELLSDPQGVDFKPYLIKVLAAVRRNWHAVMPESARLGRSGRVIIQFAISKEGAVPKLVIAIPSGAEALDRAAVAGISASNPFPPLPGEFKGGQIRLQLAFKYNLP